MKPRNSPCRLPVADCACWRGGHCIDHPIADIEQVENRLTTPCNVLEGTSRRDYGSSDRRMNILPAIRASVVFEPEMERVSEIEARYSKRNEPNIKSASLVTDILRSSEDKGSCGPTAVDTSDCPGDECGVCRLRGNG